MWRRSSGLEMAREGARGGGGVSVVLARAAIFAKGKETGLRGSNFLKVAVDWGSVLTVWSYFIATFRSQCTTKGNGFFAGDEPLKDKFKYKHFKPCPGIRSVWTEVLFWLWKLRRGSHPGPLTGHSEPPEWT